MKYTTRSFLLAGFSALTVLALTSAATATIIVQDDFSTNGSLTGTTPDVGGIWTNHSGTSGQTQVVAGQVNLVQPTQSEDNNTGFLGGAIGAGDELYAAFDLTVPSQGNAVTSAYFAHFKDATNFFGARLWMAPPTTSGYKLVLSGDNSITDLDGEVAWGSDLAFGSTYRVVTYYDYDTGATKLWVDPTMEASTSVSAGDGFAGDEFQAYAFRQSTSTPTQVIDNLVVATTFDEVLGDVIPEPASVALALIAGLGLVGFRRRYA